MNKQTIPTLEEVISHFRSLDVTEKQKKAIYENSLRRQYTIVTHGRNAINEHMKYQEQHHQLIESDIRVKDRIGHCTRCHHEYVLPNESRLSLDKEFTCPVCGGKNQLISAYRGKETKTIKQYITFFESSIKDPSVILCKGVLVVRDISGDYKHCDTKFYTVTLYMFKKGYGSTMYVRDIYYNQNTGDWDKWTPYGLFLRVGPDGMSSPWRLQKQLGDKFKVWHDRGYNAFWDKNSFWNMLQKKEFKHCEFRTLCMHDDWGDSTIYFEDAIEFLQIYCKYPHIEFLIKSGMGGLVLSKMFPRGHTTIHSINWRTKDRKKFLKFKLSKADKKFIREHGNVKTDTFNIFALAQRNGQRISMKEADNFRHESFISISCKTTMIPDIRKINAYAEKQRKFMVHDRKKFSRSMFIHDYMDYIDECHKLGYDLSDKGISWPRDLQKAHRETSYLVTLKDQQEKLKAMSAKRLSYDGRIKKIAKKLAFLVYEDDRFIIRPAVSVDELIVEGSCNHNCVGTYIERYAAGKTAILFIREKGNPNLPFYTMEVNPRTGIMIQCRKKYNEIAEKGSAVDIFVKRYKNEVLQKIQNQGERVKTA